MDPKQLFTDERLNDICIYCGDTPDSRDHVPSKILLDKPYPVNLSVVESCSSCNQGFSVAEQYLACFVDCVLNGTTVSNSNFRPKIAATLKSRPSIGGKIEGSKLQQEDGSIIWQPDVQLMKVVVIKLARGHIAYELGVQMFEEPVFINIFSLYGSDDKDIEQFYYLPSSQKAPEIGCRGFVNLFSGKATGYESWHVVQPDRYQYSVGQSGGNWAKILISEYLACHVAWE